MKIRTALLLIPVLLALCVGTAVAKAPPAKPGVDPSFGHGGTIAVSVPKGSIKGQVEMATAPSGKSYVLAGSTLLAIGANGRPDPGFGHNGRLTVAAAAGETTEVTGLAVDANGRILVSGSVNPTPGVPAGVVPPGSFSLHPEARSNAFVVRYLPDGERDPTFGGAGEIDVTVTPHPEDPTAPSTHLDSPAVHAGRLAVVNGEQPVLGGSYSYDLLYCRTLALQSSAFVSPIDPGGANFQTLAPTQVQQNTVIDFASMPAGNLAVLSNSAPSCGNVGAPFAGTISALTYSSTPAPALDPIRPALSLSTLAVDSYGRFLGLEGPEELPSNGAAPPWKIVRLLPNGDFDTGFGSNGGVPLKKFGEESVGGLVVGADGRQVIAGGDNSFRLVRLGTKGKVDQSFGSHGWIEVGFGKGSKASPQALTIDAKGRVLAAGPVTSPSLKTGEGIGLTRSTTK